MISPPYLPISPPDLPQTSPRPPPDLPQTSPRPPPDLPRISPTPPSYLPHISPISPRRCPRYGLQADSFYTTQNSLDNVFEFNILADTNRLTTDTGAIEMLGSGNPGLCGNGSAGWFTNNTVRFNNISHTVGSSSSDGSHVCVHGAGGPPGSCRGLVWGVYLDGGMSGATVHGNVIGATLHGAVFDNAGGNNSITNNVFVGGAGSSVLMNFGTAGGPANPDPVSGVVPSRDIAGSTVKRNIFYFGAGMGADGGVAGRAAAVASMVPWQDEELKNNGSNFNLFFAEEFDAAAVPLFPGGRNLTSWRAGKAPPSLLRCADGARASLVLSEDCSWAWELRADGDEAGVRLAPSAATVAARPFAAGVVVSIDCEGDWAHCSDPAGARTRVCMDAPHGALPVRNQAWSLGADATLRQLGGGACLQVCYEFAAMNEWLLISSSRWRRLPPGVRARRGRRRMQREGGLDPAARRVHRRRQPALVAGQRHGAAPSRQREQGFVRLAAAAGALHSLSPLSSLLSPLPSPLSPAASLLSSTASLLSGALQQWRRRALHRGRPALRQPVARRLSRGGWVARPQAWLRADPAHRGAHCTVCRRRLVLGDGVARRLHKRPLLGRAADVTEHALGA